MAIKTEQQIERDFYAFLTASELGAAIQGAIYRSEIRPRDAVTEDLVVKFLAGEDEQVQAGIVVLNLYVPDISYTDGRKVADHARIAELQELILAFVNDNDDTEYWLSNDATPVTMAVEGIEQHFIYARIKFRRITAE